MNILLVSQCSKRALTETRRILDQFAERRGSRSWQTAITLEGLKTLHRLLRKTARKNTAVACYRLHRGGSELLWIVGNAGLFNERGATPTNTTTRDVLRDQDEDDWRTGEDIRLLAALAALLHDLGKANRAFQDKLHSQIPIADVYRHEWVSLRLFQALVGQAKDDREWLERLRDLDEAGVRVLFGRLLRDDQGRAAPPFRDLPPIARAVGWLILTHHRLPMKPGPEKGGRRGVKEEFLNGLPDHLEAGWCGTRARRGDEKEKDFERLRARCWNFPEGTAFDSLHWRQHAGKLAGRLLQRQALFTQNWLDNPYVLHLARLGLTLADHYYSNQPSHARYGDARFPLLANTGKDGSAGQRLDEHLIGVEVNASRLLRHLPRLAGQVSRIARHKGFRRRSKDRRFAWQDRAFDLAGSIRPRTREQGFFGINMASTGTGKTLANGKIAYALADPRLGARFNIALGLRSLTLQTGDVYRERLHLGAEDMAVLVGGGAIRELHEQQRRQTEREQPVQRGSESMEELLEPGNFVHYEGSLEDGPLSKWLENNRDARKLLAAPVLISTIDHLMPATESTRGGHQIAPMLRLLTSDLILDEPDDFDLDDLPALSRLVHWAGLLGSRVLLSSATLPPALVYGLYEAYRAGRAVFQQNRGGPGRPVNICCAWFDEFDRDARDCADLEHFAEHHRRFVDRRLRRLAGQPRRRRACIRVLPTGLRPGIAREDLYPAWAQLLRDEAERLHDLHASHDPRTEKRLSCGLIRMAHIDDIIPTAQALLQLGAHEGRRIHLCVYHSRHPLLMRSRLEERLDRLLQRHRPEHLFEQPEIRAMLDGHDEGDQLFIVLASPVAEVGRDHDYDWAIVEPSSMRSIIQLAGRVRRHRWEPVEEPNIVLLQTNIAHLLNAGKEPAFWKPGFETPLADKKEIPLLASHRLDELLREEQWTRIDASPRIREPEELRPRNNLADLEHAQLCALMGLGRHEAVPESTPASHWWRTRTHLSGELQRIQPFRYDPEGKRRYYLQPGEDGELNFRRMEKQRPDTDQSGRLSSMTPEPGERISLFTAPEDYAEALEAQAEATGMELAACARRFGVIDLSERRGEQPDWLYHPALGFLKKFQ